MKTNIASVLGALFLLLLVASCVKDPEPTGGGGNSNEVTTSIRFTAIKDSSTLPGVFVGITPNHADRDNGIYLFTGTTNSNGWVEFADLDTLTYWYSASYSSTTGAIVREGSITLDEGDQVKRDLNF